VYDRHPLVPLLEFSALHVDAEWHAVRVRALFEQLDTTHAWDTGATCEAFCGARGTGGLRLRFAGWSVHAVCGILTQGGRDGVVALGFKRRLAAPKLQPKKPATVRRTSSVTDEDR
jgi:hypothetical protein